MAGKAAGFGTGVGVGVGLGIAGLQDLNGAAGNNIFQGTMASTAGGMSMGVGALSTLFGAYEVGMGIDRCWTSNDDAAAGTLGKGQIGDGVGGMLKGGVGIAQSAVNMQAAVQSGASAGEAIVSAGTAGAGGLATAGAALGVVGGTVVAGQGVYGLARAGQKLRKMHEFKKARNGPVTKEGEAWLKLISDAQGIKAAMATLKILGGVLGIVGGVLLLTSNPVGWIAALAGGVVGGAVAGWKLRKQYKLGKARKKVGRAHKDEMKRLAEKIEKPEAKAVKQPGKSKFQKFKSLFRRSSKNKAADAGSKSVQSGEEESESFSWTDNPLWQGREEESWTDNPLRQGREEESWTDNPLRQGREEETEIQGEADIQGEAAATAAPDPQSVTGDLQVDHNVNGRLPADEKKRKTEEAQELAQKIEESIDKLTKMGGDIRDALLIAPDDVKTNWKKVTKGDTLARQLGHDGMLAVSILNISHKQAESVSGPRLIAERARETTGL